MLTSLLPSSLWSIASHIYSVGSSKKTKLQISALYMKKGKCIIRQIHLGDLFLSSRAVIEKKPRNYRWVKFTHFISLNSKSPNTTATRRKTPKTTHRIVTKLDGGLSTFTVNENNHCHTSTLTDKKMKL